LQSLSLLHPLPGSIVTHVSVFGSQVPTLHSALLVQGPSPTAKPQALVFVSQTLDTHTRLPTVTSHVATLDGVIGSDLPLTSLASHMPRVPPVALHHWDDRQSESEAHSDVQSPLVVSQRWPECPAHSAFVPHLPHCPAIAPERKQKGSAIVPHDSDVAAPKSPSQATHVEVGTSHTGSSLGHLAELVHWTQAFVVALQAGVAPEHCEFIVQATQRFSFGPVVAQMADRQSVVPSDESHGPSLLAYPHLLSCTSQTPLVHTSVPTMAVQVPFKIGLVCAASVGTTTPLASCATQTWVVSLHQVPVEQSASTTQVAGASQTPLLLHRPERHTVPALPDVQGPSPLA
jgi:hypothetical protein